MQNWITRWLSILLLGALVALGSSNWAVASSSVVPEMAQLGLVSEAMPSMDCHDGSSSDGCSSDMIFCALGCTAPGLDLPLAVEIAERIANIRAAAAPATDPADGLMPAPGLPPPRSLDES